MSHVQLTDEPCPKCGASLDIEVKVTGEEVPEGGGLPQHRPTPRLERVKVCPDCGWTQTA